MKKKRETKHKAGKKEVPKAAEKKRNLHILIFAVIAVILLLMLIPQINKNSAVEATKIKVENMEFKETADQEFLSFDIVNDYAEPVECLVVFSYGSQAINWNIGEVEPNTRKNYKKEVFMPAGETRVKLTAKCQRK